MDIDIVIYDGFDELDAIAPYEVLRHAEKQGADIHATLVGAHGRGEVVASHGTRIAVNRAPSADADMVLVPGGGWNDRSARGARAEAERGVLPGFIADAHARGVQIASVCTGAMVVAASGVLDGRRATTHHGALDDLRAAGAVAVDARVVDDGDVLSAGGVTSGIDLALWIVERFAGADAAAGVAAEIEHERTGAVAVA